MPCNRAILHRGLRASRIRSRNHRQRKTRLPPERRGRAHLSIPRGRDLFPSPAEPGCAAQAAGSGGRADSAGAEARELAVRQGSARQPVESAFLVRPHAEFTGVAPGEQAIQGSRFVSDSVVSRFASWTKMTNEECVMTSGMPKSELRTIRVRGGSSFEQSSCLISHRPASFHSPLSN